MADSNRFGPKTFFHTILFAYQKKLKEILGSGEAIFVHPVLDTITLIEQENNFKFIQGETLDEIFDNYAKQLTDSEVTKKATFTKLGPDKYELSVEGCKFAESVHDLLKPKDVACPYALIAMSIFQSKTGKKVKGAESEFTSTGADTIIQADD